MLIPPPGYRLLISPELLTDAELERHTHRHPTTVWKEGDYWRICRWCTGHEAFKLLAQGWEVFDDDD